MKRSSNVRETPPGTLNRRQFMAACAACTAFVSVGRMAVTNVFAQTASIGYKPKIRLVFTHLPTDTATWPNKGYDYEGRKKELTLRLQSACPNVEFFPVTLKNAEEADTLLKSDAGVDGYLVYLIGIWNGAPRKIAFSGRPTILVDDPYAGSGEFLIDYAAAKRQGMKVVGISSSRFEDVTDAVKAIECIKKLKSSVILAVTDRKELWGNPQVIKDVFGTEIKQVLSSEIQEAYKQADPSKAKIWADRWIRNAERVVEPSVEEIEKSGRMYVAMQNLLEKYHSNAITVDCLSLFYGGKLPAYPCLGFFQLNNDGLVGACEGDLPSTVCMLMATNLTGRPGYISDPVIDTANHRIVYAHCVASNRVFGSNGPANPYHIRSHSEDRKGAAIRSFLPVGEMTTSIEFNTERKDMVLHQAVSEENIDEDKACRTKLAARVKGDMDKLMTEWDRFGWHRVTVYGDYQKTVETIAALLGIPVVHET